MSKSPRARSRRVLIGLVPRLIRNAIDSRRELPATIVEAWAFGSILRTDAPHDLDIVLLYEQSPAQKHKWTWFRSIFSTGYSTLGPSAQAAREKLHGALDKEYYQRDRPSLAETLRRPRTSRIAEALRLNVDWASCFSWTEYVRGEHGDGFFRPGIDKIFRRFIVGRLAQQGLQVQFMEKGTFRTRDSIHLDKVKNYVKVWETSTPVQAIPGAFKGPRDYHRREFDHLRQQVVQGIGELTGKVDELRDLAKDASIDIPFRNLVPHQPLTEMPTDEQLLRRRCGELRTTVRQIDKLNAFFVNAQAALRSNKTLTTITSRLLSEISSPLTEDDVRDFLRRLRLPEHDFVIYRGDPVYPGTEENRIKVVEQEQKWVQAHKLELRIRKLLPEKRHWQVGLNPRPTDEVIQIADGNDVRVVGTQVDVYLTYSFPETVNLRRHAKGKLEAAGWTVRFREYEGMTASIGLHFDLNRDGWGTVKSRVDQTLNAFDLAVSES